MTVGVMWEQFLTITLRFFLEKILCVKCGALWVSVGASHPHV
jgi:hypothetical protein